jgi:hypothetical protein
VPTARALSSPGSVLVGTDTPKAAAPIAISTAVTMTDMTIDVPIRPAKTIHGATGVARWRLSVPLSRARVKPMASVTKEAEMTARAMNAGTCSVEARTLS